MIRCLLSGARDRWHSFVGGVLHPEDLTDYCDSLASASCQGCDERNHRIDRLTRKNGDLLRRVRHAEAQVELLGLVNEDLRRLTVGLETERDRAVIDLRDLMDLRRGTHPSELIERDDQ